eukprot:1159606-Pelagomonas_calceolata.AAC.8
MLVCPSHTQCTCRHIRTSVQAHTHARSHPHLLLILLDDAQVAVQHAPHGRLPLGAASLTVTAAAAAAAPAAPAAPAASAAGATSTSAVAEERVVHSHCARPTTLRRTHQQACWNI